MKITRRQLRKIIIETLLIESKDEIEKLKKEFDQIMTFLKDPNLSSALAEDYYMRAEDIQKKIGSLVKQKYEKPKEPQVMDKVDIKKTEFEDAFDDFGDANEIVPYTPDTKSGGGFTGYYDKQKKQFLDKKRSRRTVFKVDINFTLHTNQEYLARANDYEN